MSNTRSVNRTKDRSSDGLRKGERPKTRPVKTRTLRRNREVCIPINSRKSRLRSTVKESLRRFCKRFLPKETMKRLMGHIKEASLLALNVNEIKWTEQTTEETMIMYSRDYLTILLCKPFEFLHNFHLKHPKNSSSLIFNGHFVLLICLSFVLVARDNGR